MRSQIPPGPGSFPEFSQESWDLGRGWRARSQGMGKRKIWVGCEVWNSQSSWGCVRGAVGVGMGSLKSIPSHVVITPWLSGHSAFVLLWDCSFVPKIRIFSPHSPIRVVITPIIACQQPPIHKKLLLRKKEQLRAFFGAEKDQGMISALCSPSTPVAHSAPLSSGAFYTKKIEFSFFLHQKTRIFFFFYFFFFSLPFRNCFLFFFTLVLFFHETPCC